MTPGAISILTLSMIAAAFSNFMGSVYVVTKEHGIALWDLARWRGGEHRHSICSPFRASACRARRLPCSSAAARIPDAHGQREKAAAVPPCGQEARAWCARAARQTAAMLLRPARLTRRAGGVFSLSLCARCSPPRRRCFKESRWFS